MDLHLVQWGVIPGEPEANLGLARDLLDRTRPEKGSLILLPEMFPCGFHYPGLAAAASRAAEIIGWMADAARLFRSCLTGSLPAAVSGGIANTMVFLDEKGNVSGAYDKIHLFPPAGEEDFFVPGDHTVVLSREDMNVGLAICFDLRFPEMGRRLADQGARLMAVSAYWPLERLGHFSDLVKVRAMENQFFVAGCNSCGKDAKGVAIGGGSMVAGPSGEIRGVLGREEGVLSVTVEPLEVERTRERFPVLSRRRKDLFPWPGS
ncbi:MAG: hypothetical protein JXR72_06685 [Proteobacteria bacterium]|nr:hypothetical protein [Pseudomonadota bacterium]